MHCIETTDISLAAYRSDSTNCIGITDEPLAA